MTSIPFDGSVHLPGATSALRDSGLLAGRHLRRLFRAPGKLLGITLNPLVMMLTVGYLFRRSIVVQDTPDYVEYIMAGVTAQVGLSSIGPTALTLALDMREGIIDRLLSLPVRRYTILVAHAAADLVAAGVGLAAVLLFGLALGWRIHTGPLQALAGFLLLGAFIYAMCWVGLAVGLAMRNIEAIESVGALVMIFLTFMSNSFLAVQGLPGWVQPLADWNPVSAVVAACRQLWGNPLGPTDTFAAQHATAVALLSILICLLVAVPLSYLGFRRRTRA